MTHEQSTDTLSLFDTPSNAPQPQPCSDSPLPDALLARMGARFGACEVARTLAWVSVQFYPAAKTRAEVLEKLRAFEAAVAEVRQEFEREG
jgi:hypothetical protein